MPPEKGKNPSDDFARHALCYAAIFLLLLGSVLGLYSIAAMHHGTLKWFYFPCASSLIMSGVYCAKGAPLGRKPPPTNPIIDHLAQSSP